MTAPATCSRGWGARCARAKNPKCRCACHGQNHGARPKPVADPSTESETQELLALIGAGSVEYRRRFTYPGLFQRPVETDLVILRSGTVPVVIATERGDNPGASITNTIEMLARELMSETGWLLGDFVLIEHYPPQRYGGLFDRSLSRVEFQRMWSSPTWHFIEPKDIAALVKQVPA